MEMEIAQDSTPAEQAVQPKQDNESQIDYRSFFEESISREQARASEIREALQTGKLSETEKLALEREEFEIEKSLHRLGVKQPTQESVVESIVEAGLKPGDGQYEFIKSAIEGLSIEEARPVVEAFREFMKAGQRPGMPADLTGGPRGRSESGEPLGFSSKDMIGQNSRAAKNNLVELMAALANKGE